MTRVPDPDALAGILAPDAVDAARRSAERFGGRDEERSNRAREAFDE